MRLGSLAAAVLTAVSAFASLHATAFAQEKSGSSTEPVSAQAYATNPKFTGALAEAKLYMRQHRFSFAVESYRKANKVAEGGCLECLKGAYAAQMADRSFKDAANTAVEIEHLATTPLSHSLAEYYRANALYESAGSKPKAEKLEQVHAVLQEAIGIYPKSAAALYLDGQVLAKLGKLDDAKGAFAKCLECVAPNDPSRLRAQHFAENPELSTHPMAPAFEVTALDGSRFNLDAMGGRVVLVDFWATWCPPCNREIPHLQKVAKEFAGQPLVMISVSVDKDEAKWKDFLDKHGMTWVQYRDSDGKLAEAFGVTTIPRYFTIDSDGVLTSVMVDEGSDIEGKLRKLVAKAREARPTSTLAGNATPATSGTHTTGN